MTHRATWRLSPEGRDTDRRAAFGHTEGEGDLREDKAAKCYITCDTRAPPKLLFPDEFPAAMCRPGLG